MDDVITAAAARRGGYILRSDLIDLGYQDRHIKELVELGTLVRIRHGTYTPTDLYRHLSPERRHLLAAYSIVDRLGGDLVLSHHTAVIAHGLPTWGLDLSTIHVTRRDRRGGRREAGIAFHRGALRDEDIVEIDGRFCVRADRAVLESCSLAGVESGMVTTSFAIRDGHCTREQLEERRMTMDRWPDTLSIRLSLRYAEPRCESVGEVRSVHMFRTEGIPMPEMQVEVVIDGVVVGRSDFGWWLFRHLGEFDGLIKYGRLNPDPQRMEQVLVQEKEREDLMRAYPAGMSRWLWDGLAPRLRPVTGRMIKRGLEQSRRLYLRDATVIDLGRPPQRWVA